MANALTLFDQLNAVKGGFVLPADAAGFLDEVGSNITDRATVPSMTYAGKEWTISMNGEKTRVERRDSDGDMVPVATVKVVVLGYNPKRGRAYYEGSYDRDKIAMPICWSDDGDAPDASVPADQKQAAKCAACPLAVKGSKVSDNGKQTKACSEHRMMAVMPVTPTMDFQPLRLKIAITSDWDKQSPDNEAKGWFGFQNYTEFLRAKGITHSALLVTKMKFDNTEYPKIIFSPDRFLTAEEREIIKPAVLGDEVKNLIAGRFTPNGVDGTEKAPAIAAPAAKAAPAPKAPEPEEEEEDAVFAPAAPAPAPAPKAAAKKAAAPKAEVAAVKAEAKAEKFIKPASDAEDDDGEIQLPGSAPVKAKDVTPAKPKVQVAADLPEDLQSILGDWGGNDD